MPLISLPFWIEFNSSNLEQASVRILLVFHLQSPNGCHLLRCERYVVFILRCARNVLNHYIDLLFGIALLEIYYVDKIDILEVLGRFEGRREDQP